MGNAILVLITLGFLAGLVPMALIAFKPLYQSFEARHWQAVPAVIQSVVVGQPDRRQYLIEARYTYEWGGEEITGARVFFDEMVGVRHAYYGNIQRQLHRHMTPENPISILVDPEAPERSVIYPAVRWDKFAANLTLFGIWALITAGLAGACWAALRPDRKPD